MSVLTIFAYVLATLFLITLTRVLLKLAPDYWSIIKVWYLKKKGYTYHYFNKGNIKVLAKDRDRAYNKYKAYKKSILIKTNRR